MNVRSDAISRHRSEIDGLRAIAVVAVILFHGGLLPSGFLGVDVFFVISGYLITGIIAQEVESGRFSIRRFYLRRVRRILPLAVFICIVALGLGLWRMLPDDLENLAQSIVATNLFANNVLQAITTRNYWDVVNEYKPLLHTWSLGIEEQYYFLYPLLFLFATRKRLPVIAAVLLTLLVLSLGLHLGDFPHFHKFYQLPFRFWELAIGGVAALLLKDRLLGAAMAPWSLAILASCLVIEAGYIPALLHQILCVLATLALLTTRTADNVLTRTVLQNPVSVFIGKISFSLYMWHQLLLAFARYAVVPEISRPVLMGLISLTFALSVLTYYFIEQPFRDARRTSARFVVGTVAAAWLVSSAVAFYVYSRGGVIRDVPELDLAGDAAVPGIHSQYNDRVYEFDRHFSGQPGKTRVLVVGDSYARDWANVLLESKWGTNLEISYVYDDEEIKLADRARAADVVFFTNPDHRVMDRFGVSREKVWVVGPKNFGRSNGIFYNYRGPGYLQQRTEVDPEVLTANEREKKRWGSRYIDLIGLVADRNATVPVFTPQGKFISADCRHLTQSGARYFASLVNELDLPLRRGHLEAGRPAEASSSQRSLQSLPRTSG
jgi:peptidoglycan/LPS O-acetylase OafA/YrhL